jgi:hypothetical protein
LTSLFPFYFIYFYYMIYIFDTVVSIEEK